MGSFKDLLKSDQPVLVDFYADWCGPCKTMAPQLVKLAEKVKGKAKVLKVDVDRNPRAAQQYDVRSIPTLILFKNGKILWRKSGVVDAATLEKIIAQHS